jgi:2',3'-cyclic-nucleotide 2'-phosphodiesterase (5'-nucleotidase family)
MISLSGCVETKENDGTPPYFINLNDMTHVIGDPLPDLLENISAEDEIDGNITSKIEIDDSKVNYLLPGTYVISYSISDAAGNKTTLNRTIIITDTVSEMGLTIYYINDTHGAIESYNDQLGLAAIGNLVLNEKEINPDKTLFIGGGDLLQGNILSNYYYGNSMIDILNTMQLDAFVLGNHEFDWGLETITKYKDSSSGEIQADFPLLGANIFRKDTMELPDFVEPYTVIQKGNIKVGVIGLMGYGLESSIATARIQDYMFDDPIEWASYYAHYLRTEESVDVVLAVVHGNSDYTNDGIAALTGDYRVDAIFNGHSHSRYTQVISRSGVDVPIIQSKANGEFVGRVTLSIDANREVTDYQLTNLHPTRTNSSASDRITKEIRLSQGNSAIQTLIDEYKLAIDDLLNEVIITSSSSYDETSLTEYMAEIIRTSVDADIGIHNYGGTRTGISSGQGITVATLYQIFPFDNRVKYVYVTGEDIKDYANSSVAFAYRSGLSLSQLKDDTYYKVATNDYIFDKPEYPFISGEDPIDTGYLIRDLLEQVLRNQALSYPSFSTEYPIDFQTTNG